MRANTTTAVVLTACLLLIASCGSGGEDKASDTTTTTQSTTTTTEATTTTAAADTLGAFGPGCAEIPAEGPGSFASLATIDSSKAIAATSQLSTLSNALNLAGMGETLAGEGPFTIFAPIDSAFTAIPADQLSTAMADNTMLTTVLSYHVIVGESLTASDLAAMKTVTTAQGGDLSFGPEGTVVNGASVVCSDITVSNGTIHLVGSLLLPDEVIDSLAFADDTEESNAPGASPISGSGCSALTVNEPSSMAQMAQEPVVTAASANPELSKLVTAIAKAGMIESLNSDNSFTIFAPTDTAFDAIPSAEMEAALSDPTTLTSILNNHVISGEELSARDLLDAGSAETIGGQTLTFTAADSDDGALVVNGVATTTCWNVPTANAIVHIVDSVLLPNP